MPVWGYANPYYVLASSGASNFKAFTVTNTSYHRDDTVVVFYYDFALTMPQEIKHVWSSKLKLINVLVIALRYITALGYIPVLVLTFESVISSGSGETVSTNECCEVKLTE